MPNTPVKELMVPLAEYATVREDATVKDAVASLREARALWCTSREAHRAVLVLDQAGHVVGKLGQIDIIRALEPKYAQLEGGHGLTRSGLSLSVIREMLDSQGLWEQSLDNLCSTAAPFKVSQIMHTPGEGEYVRADDTLATALHQLVMGHHQSLLVTEGEKIVGVLRLADVFEVLSQRIANCQL